VMDIFEIRVLWTICPGWLQMAILLISASWVARITGVGHRHLAFPSWGSPAKLPNLYLNVNVPGQLVSFFLELRSAVWTAQMLSESLKKLHTWASMKFNEHESQTSYAPGIVQHTGIWQWLNDIFPLKGSEIAEDTQDEFWSLVSGDTRQYLMIRMVKGWESLTFSHEGLYSWIFLFVLDLNKDKSLNVETKKL
jgi:hypothetical protein